MTKPYVVDGHVRPMKRSECPTQRPCPWVSCRHHLAIDISKAMPKDERSDPRATTIRVNHAPSGAYKPGRRVGLSPYAASCIVRQWISDAAESLFMMEATCALDVTAAAPDGLAPSLIARLIGVTEPTIDQEIRKPHIREALAGLGRDFFMDPKRMGRRNSARTGSAAREGKAK